MSDLFKKAGKGVGKLTGNAVKSVFTALLSEVASEILQETGVMDIAKDKIVDIGLQLVKSQNLDMKSVKKDFIKKAILNELKLQ